MSVRGDAARFSDDLDEWLKTAATADDEPTERYVVDRILRETPEEITQVVYRRSGTGERIGPFVRKRFVEDARRGQAYRRILRAQANGIRLAHQPVVYECERVDSSVDVVMEYLHGETLRTLVLREGPGVELAKRVVPQLCDALTELHESFEQPLIHRDVKPSNIMMCAEDLKLIDLGIARTYHEDAACDTVRCGTPGYAPPEQFGYEQTSTRSDVYALGMTLAFCLTAEDPSAQLREQLLVDPRVPKNLAPVVSRATEFDPERRYASTREFKEDFVRALDGRCRASQKSTKPERTWSALFIAACAVFAFACVRVSLMPAAQFAGQYPLWLTPIICFVLALVPVTSLVYLLLDKRRLRQREPLGKPSRHIEVPACLAASFECMLFVMLLGTVARY